MFLIDSVRNFTDTKSELLILPLTPYNYHKPTDTTASDLASTQSRTFKIKPLVNYLQTTYVSQRLSLMHIRHVHLHEQSSRPKCVSDAHARVRVSAGVVDDYS